MIAVKVFWNTHPDGSPVDTEKVDWDAEDAPISIYGPFDSIDDAQDWMDNDYPEGDDDVHDMEADDYDIPSDWVIADPDSIHGDIPDEEGPETTEEQDHDKGPLT